MRYQHVTFRKLAAGEEFFTKKFRYTKTSFFTGRMVLDGELIFVSPWRKVRSTRPFGPAALLAIEHVNRTLAANADYVNVINEGFKTIQAREARPPGADNVCYGRPPVAVTPGGDRTPEAIGGNEKCPSA